MVQLRTECSLYNVPLISSPRCGDLGFSIGEWHAVKDQGLVRSCEDPVSGLNAKTIKIVLRYEQIPRSQDKTQI